MTTDDRTPSTREVRSMYVAGSTLYRETPEQHYLGHPAPDYGAEFDRWLTAHDARVRRDAKAEAWDACVDEAAACGWTTGYASRDVRDRNPYRETGDQR